MPTFEQFILMQYNASMRAYRLKHIKKASLMYRTLGRIVALGYLRKHIILDCEARRLLTIAVQLSATKGL